MGSDLGDNVKHKARQMNNMYQLLISFVLGMVVMHYWSNNHNSCNGTTRGGVGGGGGCKFSFGPYHGHEYTTPSSNNNGDAGADGSNTIIQTVGKPQCLLESKWMKVQQHHVQMGTNLIDDWLWIDYHDRVNVLVQAPSSATATAASEDTTTSNNNNSMKFYIFEQSKYALENKLSYAIIGGIIEPGEEPIRTAQREVNEEMSLQCSKFVFLGRYRTDVNRGMGWLNSYLAMECEKDNNKKQKQISSNNDKAEEEEVGVQDTERQDLKTITYDELKHAVMNDHHFFEVQWTATISLAILYLEEKQQKK